jgi:uncharacterized protein
MTTAPLRGRLLWYELMTSDLAAAERFYTAVVGWGTSPFDGSPTPYTMWMRDGQVPVGGAMTLPPDLSSRGVPPHWMMYVGAERLEDLVADAERLGGGVLSPVIDVPEVGRMQTLKDPQGAAFSLYQPSTPPASPEAPAEVGDASWLELYTWDRWASTTCSAAPSTRWAG